MRQNFAPYDPKFLNFLLPNRTPTLLQSLTFNDTCTEQRRRQLRNKDTLYESQQRQWTRVGRYHYRYTTDRRHSIQNHQSPYGGRDYQPAVPIQKLF
jgi:hypothetical protein